MTAEIAVLNKYAAAIAADSKVTISAGDEDKKIFDSADKIFELSNIQPIAVMVWNDLSFSGEPIPNLVREFRGAHSKSVDRVDDIAKDFLKFLSETGRTLSGDISEQYFSRSVFSILRKISKLFEELFFKEFTKQFQNNPSPTEVEAAEFSDNLIKKICSAMVSQSSNLEKANFLDGPPRFTKKYKDIITACAKIEFKNASDDTIKLVFDAVKYFMLSSQFSSVTGLVFVGYGSKDRFPTLVSYEINGMVLNRLKYVKTDTVDIDRKGPEAAIRPFAQKDMVDRFLHGLDALTQKRIISFSENSIGSISEAILSKITFSSSLDEEKIRRIAKNAEDQYILSIKESALSRLKRDSVSDVEGMVEFMPKPDLARTAEALIDLTSIKRKVSSGMETVGGPVDVAVISKSEGFVWVKRKHYFPSELNQRYMKRGV